MHPIGSFVRHFLPYAAAFGLACAGASAAQPSRTAHDDAARTARAASAELGASLDDTMLRAWAHGFSGAFLVARGDRIVLRGAYGERDRATGAALSPDTAFDISSLDKQFIAAAILKLQEEGKLRTGDTLSRFFDFAPPDKAGITLRELLSHTSGLANAYWEDHPECPDRACFVRYMLAQPLVAAPGSAWNYSNSAYRMLEEIIARASGEPYERYLREHLFLPAGMAHTGLELPHWPGDGVARYRYWNGAPWKLDNGIDMSNPLARPAPVRSLLSTVGDLHRWYLALRDRTVLGEASVRELTTPVMAGYAYGWNVGSTAHGTRVIFHGGTDSATGMNSALRYYPDDDLLVVVLANGMLPTLNGEYLGADLETMVFGGTVALPPALDPAGAPAPRDVDGAYRFDGGNVVAVRRIDDRRLALSTKDRASSLMLMFPQSVPGAKRPDRDAAAEAIIRGIAAVDFTPLQAAVPDAARFARVKHDVEQGWAHWLDVHGPFVDVATVHRRQYASDGVPERQSYLAVQFRNGVEIVRFLRIDDAASTLQLDAVRVPETLELTAARSVSGFSTWDFKLGTGATIVLDRDGSGRRRLRVEGPGAESTGVLQPASP